MRKPQETRGRDGFLLRIARFHRSNAWHSMCLLSSVLLLALGAGVLVYTVNGAIQRGGSLILDDFALGIVGLTGIFAGWLIRLALCLSRVAHEVLLRLHDDYDEPHGTEVERRRREVTPKCADAGSSFHLPSKSELRKLSTRDLTSGWRLLVMVPLVIGVLLLVLSIGAWQVPRFGDLVCQRGMRLEYLCVGGLGLMMIGACLMPLAGIVCGRACKDDRMPE